MDEMINDIASGIATGGPVALAVALVVVYRMHKSNKEYDALSKRAGKGGYTHLMCAAWAGDLKSVRSVLDGGVEINTQDQDGMTALMHACTRADNEKVLKELIAASLSEILCVRHTMSSRSMYANQDQQEQDGGDAADHSERAH